MTMEDMFGRLGVKLNTVVAPGMDLERVVSHKSIEKKAEKGPKQQESIGSI